LFLEVLFFILLLSVYLGAIVRKGQRKLDKVLLYGLPRPKPALDFSPQCSGLDERKLLKAVPQDVLHCYKEYQGEQLKTHTKMPAGWLCIYRLSHCPFLSAPQQGQPGCRALSVPQSVACILWGGGVLQTASSRPGCSQHELGSKSVAFVGCEIQKGSLVFSETTKYI